MLTTFLMETLKELMGIHLKAVVQDDLGGELAKLREEAKEANAALEAANAVAQMLKEDHPQ